MAVTDINYELRIMRRRKAEGGRRNKIESRKSEVFFKGGRINFGII